MHIDSEVVQNVVNSAEGVQVYVRIVRCHDAFDGAASINSSLHNTAWLAWLLYAD